MDYPQTQTRMFLMVITKEDGQGGIIFEHAISVVNDYAVVNLAYALPQCKIRVYNIYGELCNLAQGIPLRP